MRTTRSGGKPLNRYSLGRWLASPRGERLLHLQEQELARLLPDMFGRVLLQIGSWGQADRLLQSGEMLLKAVVGTVPTFGAHAIASLDALPFAEKSVDAVVLPHTLEFSPAPLHVLHEVNRVLNERGRIVVLGFNPISGFGLRRLLGVPYAALPPGGRTYRAGQVCDWLELLGYEIREVRRYGSGFPWIESRADDDTFGPASLVAPFAEAYAVVARKRTIALHLIGRPALAAPRPVIGAVGLSGARRDTP